MNRTNIFVGARVQINGDGDGIIKGTISEIDDKGVLVFWDDFVTTGIMFDAIASDKSGIKLLGKGR